ncbi:hypothetical protein GCM10028824_02450 [Hymenobacter segetis]|uniref:Uncharacterized protein n=1 Tax=Hymenobacter segetis TaxID=2025509 RepID=A0ABU9LRH1_9BACT
MTLDLKEIKPITDVLGYAVLDSQKLEYSLAFMMLMLNNELNLSNNEHDEKIDNYMQSLSKKTLGNLTKQLQEIVTVSEGFKEKLESALDARNYLIHKFFHEQGENLLTINGRENALVLVKEKRKKLFECYVFLDPFIKALMGVKGRSAETLNGEIERKYEQG